METLAPSVQSEGESPENATDVLQSETAASEPLIDGPAPYLWAGVGSALIIFIVGMMLIIRGRVTHAKPRRRDKGETRTYFEPAGEDADITFDNERDDRAVKTKRDKRADAELEAADRWRDDEVSDTEVVIEHRGERDGDFTPTPPSNPEKKKSAFSGLFSKKPEPEVRSAPDLTLADEDSDRYRDHAEESDEGYSAAQTREEENEIDARSHGQDRSPAARRESPQRPQSTPDPDRRDAAVAAEHERIVHAEEAAQTALRRAAEAEALARDLQRANEEAQNVMSLGLRKQEAALDERANALIAMEKRLTALSDEFQDRIDAMSKGASLAAASAGHEGHSGVSEDHFTEFANLMGEQFDALRNTVNGAIERLSKRLDHLPSAPAGAGTATAARIQLSDLLGDALAPQRYKLAQKLSTGRTADAIIIMPGPMAPLAVDARFPAEAFDRWQMSNNAGTETELRRAVLRNIADAGEKLISPEETADCALMFIPSEHVLSELHANFSDLIQESYRARVWMVSPTSLMATLHTISAVMAGAGIREASAVNVIDELHDLRGRVSALETKRPQNGAQPTSETPASDAEKRNPERVSPAHYTDNFSSLSYTEPPAPRPKDDKPFPLR